MYCLDTDILIEYLRGNEKIVERLSNLYSHGIGLFTTFVNVCELYKGIYLSRKKEKEVADINILLYTVKPIEMDQHSCIFFGKEWARLQLAGVQTQIIDLRLQGRHTNCVGVVSPAPEVVPWVSQCELLLDFE